VRQQCATTLDNIAALVAGANLSRYGIDADLTLRDLDRVKVYVKRAADVDTVRAICARAFAPTAEVVYANVDMCRDDLLVEIEGIISPTRR
jgi:chorismatase